MNRTTHKSDRERLRIVWYGMRQRTQCPTNRDYYRYGARGIVICDRWLNDFEAFYRWAIRAGYRHGLSIDRINNDGNYEPRNCRWTDMKTQVRNSTVTKLDAKRVHAIRVLYATGEWSMRKLADLFGVTQPNIYYIVREKSWA